MVQVEPSLYILHSGYPWLTHGMFIWGRWRGGCGGVGWFYLSLIIALRILEERSSFNGDVYLMAIFTCRQVCAWQFFVFPCIVCLLLQVLLLGVLIHCRSCSRRYRECRIIGGGINSVARFDPLYMQTGAYCCLVLLI